MDTGLFPGLLLGRSPGQYSEDVTSNRDSAMLSPSVSRMGSSAYIQGGDSFRSDCASHHSSPTHKKRDSMANQSTIGGETYWLVPQAVTQQPDPVVDLTFGDLSPQHGRIALPIGGSLTSASLMSSLVSLLLITKVQQPQQQSIVMCGCRELF